MAGTWTGTVTIQRTGLPDSVARTEWIFAPVGSTGGTGYDVTATVHDGWLAITATMNTSAIPPTPLATIWSSGFYDSPRGCRGVFGSKATASADHLTGTIDGRDCLQLPDASVFRGTVSLTKVR